MSLYSTGTCNMTNNSAAVVGVGTAFVANVEAGDGFLIPGETVYYTILSVPDDTHLNLSVVYAGTTGTGKTYQIARDWTASLGLAEIQPGDPNWPYLLTQKALRKIDTLGVGLNIPDGLKWALKDYTGSNTWIEVDEATGNIGLGGKTGSDVTLHLLAGTTESKGLFLGNSGRTDGLAVWHNSTDIYYSYIDSKSNSNSATLAFRMKTSGSPVTALQILGSGNISIGDMTPSARLTIKAGTAAANTAPLKFIAGTNLTTPESGAIEFDGTNLYITIGGVRKTIQVA